MKNLLLFFISRRTIKGYEDFLINKEYTDYCSMPYDDEIDLKEFWVLYRLKFPCLFQLALKFLSIPASSGPVERLFSYAGYIIRPHRARLTPKNLEATTMLRCNCLNLLD